MKCSFANLLGAFAVAVAGVSEPLKAQQFQLPTANRTLFEKGGEEKFFVGTVGKPWTSGCFGCVRNGCDTARAC